MVDFVAEVEDGFLEQLQIEKGSRRLIGVEERGQLINGLDGASYKVTAGGSLANSLVALAKLGRARSDASGGTRAQLQVAMAGPVGSDPLGRFFSSQMERAGVRMLTPPPPDSNTGTVAVLTTPDAQRSFLSYLGSDQRVACDDTLRTALSRTRLLVVEGYLWELPGAADAIRSAVQAARDGGALVAMTCGAAGVVQRHQRDILSLVSQGAVDVLFANREEAQALLAGGPPDSLPQQQQPDLPADRCALDLGSSTTVAVVTDGANGAAVAALGQLHVVPPCWRPEPPRDTNGAGDAWAAGFLFGLLTGGSVSASGRLGAALASEVISRPGGGLTSAEAACVLAAVQQRGAGGGGGGAGDVLQPQQLQGQVQGQQVMRAGEASA